MSDVLAELERDLAALSPDALAEIDKLLEPELSKPWLPQPGPQTLALTSQADILLYGGAAGGGKSDLVVGLTFEHRRSVIFRLQHNDLGFLEDRLLDVYGSRDGWNGSPPASLRTADGRLIEFGALGKPSAEKSWQGNPHDLIAIDEAAQIPGPKVRYVLGWNRSTVPGQRCRAVLVSNPPDHGEGDWLIEWFAPWLDPMHALYPTLPGVLRWCVTASDGHAIWVDDDGVALGPGDHTVEGETEALTAESRTFIPAKLDDNAYLKSTGYRARIMAMEEPRRSQLLHGDFLAARQDHEWQVIPSEWVRAAQDRHKRGKAEKQKMSALGVDPSLGGADDTVIAPLYGTWFDTLKKHKGVNIRSGADIGALIVKELRDGAAINIDMTGGWGDGARVHLESNKIRCSGIQFAGESFAQNKSGTYGFLNKRAELWWLFREALDPETGDDVALPPDKRLFAQLTAPRYTYKGSDIKIESKDDIKKRLGSSTDDADAVILAWHVRRNAIGRTRKAKTKRGSWLAA